jgi:flagellar motor switch protein FliM
MNPVPFDFRKPVRLPAEWHKVLMGWFQTTSALAVRGWVKQLPVELKVAANSLEDGYAREFLADLPAETIGQRIMIGDRVPTMLALPRALVLNLVGVMLGESNAQGDRELTVVEEELMDYFLVNHWFPYFRESWPGLAPPSFHLQQRETQPKYSRLFAATEILVGLHFEVRGPFGQAKGQWFFPRQPLIQALSKEPVKAPAAIDEKEVTARKTQIVRSLPLSIECILGTAHLRLSELTRLQVGDVLLLDGSAAEGATAQAGGRPLFRGQVGRTGAWKAFRIDSFIEK